MPCSGSITRQVQAATAAAAAGIVWLLVVWGQPFVVPVDKRDGRVLQSPLSLPFSPFTLSILRGLRVISAAGGRVALAAASCQVSARWLPLCLSLCLSRTPALSLLLAVSLFRCTSWHFCFACLILPCDIQAGTLIPFGWLRTLFLSLSHSLLLPCLSLSFLCCLMYVISAIS